MKILVYFNFFLTLLLLGTVSWVLVSKDTTKDSIPTPQDVIIETTNNSGVNDCGNECIKRINDAVSQAVSSMSGTIKESTKIVISTPLSKQLKTQVSYIPLSGPITTTSSSWYDAPGTDFYLDLEKDYNLNALSSWEAYLKVAHSNGTAYARLYDVTHGIAVNGSEINLSNNSSLTQISSGNLSLWAGRNLYRVQLKSLNTFEITFGSGKVKITY